MHPVIQYYPNADVNALKAFYANTTYRNAESVSLQDRAFIAFNVDTAIGLFRLCGENGIYVLRSFNVLSQYQRKGIGTALLHKFAEELPNLECYLICKQSLNGFYRIANFEVCPTPPAHLTRRANSYNNTQLNILKRPGNTLWNEN